MYVYIYIVPLSALGKQGLDFSNIPGTTTTPKEQSFNQADSDNLLCLLFKDEGA